jgi:hypothetical protein
MLASINTAVKTGLKKYHDTCFSRSGVWFDFSTLYTTIPHTLQQSRIKELIQDWKYGKQRFQYLVIGKDKSYKKHSKSNNKYKQDESIQMLDLNRQYICPVWWTCVSTNDWYSNGYELWFPISRFVSTCL